MVVETFVAKAAVQALHEAVLSRLAGHDVVPRDAVVLVPLQDRPRCQLGAVVRDDHQRTASRRSDGRMIAV